MPDHTLRKIAGLCGIAGPIALTVYFAAPALTNWPYAGASAAQLTAYANSHQTLFFAGAWFQATGTLLSIVFFLAIIQLAGAATRLPGLVVIVASAALLGLVLVEGALLIEVPLAAANSDSATVVTSFDLSNGVFARVFPLAPASAAYVGLGAVILGSTVLHRWFGYAAVGLGLAFEVAGIIALFTIVGLVLAIISRWRRSCGLSPPRSLSGGQPEALARRTACEAPHFALHLTRRVPPAALCACPPHGQLASRQLTRRETEGYGLENRMVAVPVSGVDRAKASDSETAHRELAERGVAVSDITDLSWSRFVYFSDPDGNKWAVQELPRRN